VRIRGQLISPVGHTDSRAGRLAVRPGGLAGKRIVLLDNAKPGAESILRRLGELLYAHERAVLPPLRVKPSASAGVPSALAADIRACADLVITGVGD
jgi:hypothetical protein